MKIIGLETTGYRNLADGAFLPGEGVNVLCGDNGQGKTNLLEAVWLFTGERSFRGAGGKDLVRIGGTVASLRMKFEARGTENEAKLTLGAGRAAPGRGASGHAAPEDAADGDAEPERGAPGRAISGRTAPGRAASLNGIGLESPAKLAGAFCAVVFSPDHLGLVKEGPRIRRHFLDAAICQLWPRHAAALLEYGRALFQRNALLKDIPAHSGLLDTLPVWDEKIAAVGAHIEFTRLRYLQKLAPFAKDSYDGIAGGGETLGTAYLSAEGAPLGLKPGETAEAARRRMYQALLDAHRKNVKTDVERGFTAAGPHREELYLTVNGISARLYGSQGQQRSAVLALKLAEAAVLRQTLGEPPVLLLDDVMSELDRGRQEYLFSRLKGFQIFITFCDPAGFAAVHGGNVFEVRAGHITPGEG